MTAGCYLIQRMHVVQRHAKCGWCPENNEPPAKKQKVEEEILMSEDVEDNGGYRHLWKSD